MKKKFKVKHLVPIILLLIVTIGILSGAVHSHPTFWGFVTVMSGIALFVLILLYIIINWDETIF